MMFRMLVLWMLVAVLTGQCQTPIPIILDTDIGDDIDDALALALALQSPELDLRAITTVSDDTESRTRLAWKELGLYGRQDIPLATGASDTLVAPGRMGRSAQFEVLTPEDVPGAAARRRGVDLIIETLLASTQKITLVPIGPLTNIALALKTEPRIKAKIERIVLMGGAFDLQRAEYNIHRDYLAASIVFRSGVPITAVGLDVTVRCRLQGADLDRLRAAEHPAARFLVRLIELWQRHRPDQFPVLHDPLAVATTFQPALVETQLGDVEVETSGALTQGFTLFRPPEQMPKGATPLTRVARQVDVRRFLDLFVQRLSSLPRGK